MTTNVLITFNLIHISSDFLRVSFVRMFLLRVRIIPRITALDLKNVNIIAIVNI